MKLLRMTVMCLAALAAPGLAQAVTIYQCEDAQGGITYQERCPPGTVPLEHKDYRTRPGAAQEEGAAPPPALVYVVPDCETCAQVREFLTVRNVTFSEVNVQDDSSLQDELKARSGELRVPTTVIGDSTVIGYNRNALAEALTAAGYEEPAAAEPGTGEESGTATP